MLFQFISNSKNGKSQDSEKHQRVSNQWQELSIDGWTASNELEHAGSERESKTTKEAMRNQNYAALYRY